MDFKKLIGINIEFAPIDKESIDLERNDFELEQNEGLPEKWYLTAKNGAFEMILDAEKVIETIFLYPNDLEEFLFDDFNTECGRAVVRQRMGIPDKTGEAFESVMLGANGGFDRFDREIAYHFEYADNAQTVLKKITLMALKVLP